jgi:hypothetical protein
MAGHAEVIPAIQPEKVFLTCTALRFSPLDDALFMRIVTGPAEQPVIDERQIHLKRFSPVNQCSAHLFRERQLSGTAPVAGGMPRMTADTQRLNRFSKTDGADAFLLSCIGYCFMTDKAVFFNNLSLPVKLLVGIGFLKLFLRVTDETELGLFFCTVPRAESQGSSIAQRNHHASAAARRGR